MAYSKEYIDFLHNTGRMPDRFYYQLNGGDLMTNYIQIKQRRSDEARQKYISVVLNNREEMEQKALFEKELEQQLSKAFDKGIPKEIDIAIGKQMNSTPIKITMKP